MTKEGLQSGLKRQRKEQKTEKMEDKTFENKLRRTAAQLGINNLLLFLDWPCNHYHNSMLTDATYKSFAGKDVDPPLDECLVRYGGICAEIREDLANILVITTQIKILLEEKPQLKERLRPLMEEELKRQAKKLRELKKKSLAQEMESEERS